MSSEIKWWHLKTPPAYLNMPPDYQAQAVDWNTVVKQPESSDWQMRVYGITYIPTRGNEPCWFHRWMQWLAFGFRWERRWDHTTHGTQQ